jgi:hypothetical protein
MQELYTVLFISIVAVGAYFAFKKPKKANPRLGRGGHQGGGDEQGGGETPTGVETVTPISFAGDFAHAPTVVVEEAEIPAPELKVPRKKTTKPRKKYGTRGVKKAK